MVDCTNCLDYGKPRKTEGNVNVFSCKTFGLLIEDKDSNNEKEVCYFFRPAGKIVQKRRAN